MVPVAALLALADSGRPDLAALSGGTSATAIESGQAYQQPVPLLNARELEQFTEGKKGFAQHWVVAPSILGLWGRGPISNAEACTDCHENGGRGRAPDDVSQPMRSMLVRLSIPGAGPHGGPNPDPIYGDQLQNEGILGRVPPEGDPRLSWDTRSVTMGDGEIVQLRVPALKFQSLNFGPLSSKVMTSMRVAPALIGVGLLDAVAEDTIRSAAADQHRKGLRGRPNVVWDLINNREALGRFGYKANQPSVEQQIFLAYHADLGVTSRWFPEENCTAVQLECLAEPPGGHPELPQEFVDPALLYARALAPPARRNADDAQVQRGEALFHLVGCDGCHAPTLETGESAALPALSRQTIHPFTDLLLHDMGEGLNDGRPDFRAGGRDWRTAPLWGLGLSRTVNGNDSLLHDGRARNPTEAILWHGGEAQTSRDQFAAMPRLDREALLAFLRSL
jgi:CxxC motif-containing protein (DUF1111 family)